MSDDALDDVCLDVHDQIGELQVVLDGLQELDDLGGVQVRRALSHVDDDHRVSKVNACLGARPVRRIPARSPTHALLHLLFGLADGIHGTVKVVFARFEDAAFCL